jgi:GNAT superfamily N-acetyltransferase
MHHMDIHIIQANPADAAEILALQKLAYQSEAQLNDDWTIPPLTQTLSEMETEFATTTFLKGIHKGMIIGSVKAFLNCGTCYIGRLIVHPDFQRKGFGTLLMSAIEASFPSAERYELFTGVKSIGNICFYQKLGYREFRRADLSTKIQLVYLEKRS